MSEKKPPQLTIKIENFERLVALAEFDKAVSELGAICTILEGSKEGFGKQLSSVNAAVEHEATVFAAAITNLLTHPDFGLKKSALMVFSQFKRVISQTFETSGYRGTGHFIGRLSTKGEDGKIHLQGKDIPKLFCGLSLNAMTEPMVDLFLRQNPDVTWPLLNGFLSEQLLWSPIAEKARTKLLASGAHWENVTPTRQLIQNLGPAYMGCSYADAPHKHDIKKTMNILVRRWLAEQDITDVTEVAGGRRGVKRKPTLIVMAELYNSVHAMHRCYGPAIRSLKDRFKLIYMSPDGKCDEKLHYMFDKVDDTKFSAANPKPFFDKAKSYRPDVVYYPSIGMRLMSILGSNLRIAPVQVMTFGHPATSTSTCIDYAVMVDGLVGDENTIYEKILYWPSGSRYEHRADAVPLQPKIHTNPRPLRIAVPAWSRKITPQFLAVCGQIQKNAKKRIEFVFFPNGTGALFQAFKRRVESMLNATVLPRSNYNVYIENLNTCDIFLSTFPFGATNGILDAGPLGLPVVNLKGDEAHALNDSEMVSQMKQPKWLSADTVENYVLAVLRLIENDDERVAISQANATFDYELKMMVSPDSSCAEFGQVIEAAYRQHEVLKSSPDKAWKFESLEKMTNNGK